MELDNGRFTNRETRRSRAFPATESCDLEMKFISCMTAFAMLVTLSACDQQAQYTPAANLTTQTAASITGSTIESGSAFSADTKASLWAVDNQYAYGQPSPTLVTPGTHIITVAICECGSLSAARVSGSATLLGDFKAGGNYTIRTTVPTGGQGWQQHFATVWIEDSAGLSITPQNKFEIDQGNPPIIKLFQN